MESGHRENTISLSRFITSFIRFMKTIQQEISNNQSRISKEACSSAL